MLNLELQRSALRSFLSYCANVRGLSYHTIRLYARSVNDWFDFVQGGSEGLDGRDFILFLMDKGLSPKSVNVMLTACREFYRYQCAFCGCKVNPFASIRAVKTAKHLPTYLTERQLNSYINKMPVDGIKDVRAKCVVYLLFHTGLRCHEFTTLLRSNVSAGAVKVLGGKGNKDRIVPITSETYAVFQRLFCLNQSNFAVSTVWGDGLTDRQLRQIVAKAMEGLPLATRHPHCLRHSCATALLERGVSLPFIGKFLGHSSIRTTEVYAHCSVRFLQEQYNNCFNR